VRGGSRAAEVARVGPGLLQIFSMGTILHPAQQVFDEMPERNYFLNFQRFLVGCNHILRGVEWRWWWSK
jgi:hypothetical protein